MYMYIMYLFCFLQPFLEKLTNETDPDKKAMYERLLAKVKAAVDVVEVALKDKDNSEAQTKARTVSTG